MFDDDLLHDWIAHETFRIVSDDYHQCPACEIGILNRVDSEPNTELVCDVCDAVFRVQEG
jgi:hypothetical protein